MAVIPMWQCDRDGSMFADKKAAEEHDRMLELADNLTSFLQSQMTISDSAAEEIGLLMARNKEALSRAFKGKPEMLFELMSNNEDSETSVE